MMLNL